MILKSEVNASNLSACRSKSPVTFHLGEKSVIRTLETDRGRTHAEVTCHHRGSLNLVFILGQTSAQTNTSSYTIASFNQTTFAPVGSMIVENVVGTPTGLIRWGSNGLAFTTLRGLPYGFSFGGDGPGQLYVISGAFVNASDPAKKSSPAARFAPVRRTWGISPVSSAPSTRGRVSPRVRSQ
jgi:hypothetical protein